MHLNVQKIVERGENLTDLDQRTEALTQSALQFQELSGKLERKHWLANVKLRIAMGVSGIILAIIIIGKNI